MDFLGGLLSAGANLLGGIFNRQQQNKTNADNEAQANMFAQNQLSWKALDATNAEKLTGINRLAMLGVNPGSGPSTSVFQNDDSFGRAGQDIGRAATAALSKPSRAQMLEEELVAAKIANVNADTVRQQAEASRISRTFGSAGSGPGVPLPPEDPRGPVVNLMSRYRDVDGSIVWLPSEKAASPLQTLGAAPVNAALAGRGLYEGLKGYDHPEIVPSGAAVRRNYPSSADFGWDPQY